jgi:hypothetical protein
MTDDTEDTRDPLRAAFQDYVRPPRDVVPKPEWTGSNDYLVALDETTVEVTYFDRESGCPVNEKIVVTKPVFTEKDR